MSRDTLLITLCRMLAPALCVCRYPRGNGIGVDLAAEGIGKDLKGTPLEVRAAG